MKFKIALVFMITLIATGGIYFFSWATQTNNQLELVGGNKDEHNCVPTAGFTWCEAKQKCLRTWEEGCQDSITELFETIETKTDINFLNQVDTNLAWQVEGTNSVDTLDLEALEISAKEVSKKDFQKIKDIIENDGFEFDIYNGRGSFFAEFGAYRKDNFSLVCTLSGIASDFDPDDPEYFPQTEDKDVRITIAILDKSLVPEISTEKQIAKILAAKYDVKVCQAKVTITQETENHAKGSVEFLPGGSENCGIFLAAKINNEWQVVFDGNGAIDRNILEEYNFPEDMID